MDSLGLGNLANQIGKMREESSFSSKQANAQLGKLLSTIEGSGKGTEGVRVGNGPVSAKDSTSSEKENISIAALKMDGIGRNSYQIV